MDWAFWGNLGKSIFTFSDNILQTILVYVGILGLVFFLFPRLGGKLKNKLPVIRKFGIHIAWAFILISVVMPGR